MPNTKSSTEAEHIGVGNISASYDPIWTKLFLRAQHYEIDRNISTKRTNGLLHWKRELNMKGNVTIKNCLTDDMIRDFHMKPLQDGKF